MLPHNKKPKVLVIGWTYFRTGFDFIFNGDAEFKYIGKENEWDKLTPWQRAKYARRFDVIHYFWAKVKMAEILLLKFRRSTANIILHFIGSDVTLICQKKRRIFEYKFYQALGAQIFADHQNLIDELDSIGIKAKLLTLVNANLEANEQPLPQSFSVLAYVPKNKERFYNLALIETAAERLPDIHFTVLRNDKKFIASNISSETYAENIIEEINRHHVFIRLTEHDGLPCTILEALSCARHVIWSFQHEHCYQASSVEELVQILTTLKQENSLNTKGKEFVLKNYSIDRIRKNFYEVWGAK